MNTQPGIVYLVGAGPGDPGLLTVRGAELLGACDVLVYDALANDAIVRRATRPDGAASELHFVGKRGGEEGSARQEDINALLVRLGREGRRVVRLKGGDPFVFGRGGEEAQALAAAGVPFEVVPGVTAGVAAPAYAGIPVTHRGVATSVTFVTGHEDPARSAPGTDWRALARAGGTVVLYMGVRGLTRIAAELRAGGMAGDTPAAAVQWGSYPRQRTVVGTLDTLAARVAEAGLRAPVITVIGAVAALRDELAWFDRRPLFGRRVVVTRAAAQAGALADRLRALGADVLELPALRVEPLDPAPLRAAVAGLGRYAWLVLTSQNAVRLLWDALRDAGLDARALAGVRVCVVGPATAGALLERGIAADVVPARFVAEGALEALAARAPELRGERVLYVTAADARPVLPDGLRAIGAEVDVVAAYRTVADARAAEEAEPLREALDAGAVDLVTFASASAVRHFVDAVGPALAARAPAVTIGPITSAAARAAGLTIAAEATEATMDGVVKAVTEGLRH